MSKFQSRLDDFFLKSNKNDYEIKKYFYLIWENKFRPSLQAYWTDKLPAKINFLEKINCNSFKKGYYFYLCGYFSDIDDKEYILSKEKIYKNIPYLKSHLQKSIRKGDDILAIPTAYHLLKLDKNELLRRLSIIMLEDTFLHESFTTIIWLMTASSIKKFKFKQYIYEWLIGIIYVLCKIDKKDNLNDISYINELNQINKSILEKLDNYKKLEIIDYSILYSIHLRISYGGTEDDLKMLKLFAELWEKRFTNKNISIDTMNIRPIKLLIKDLDIENWDLSAIDYHSNSNFLEYISKKFADIDKNEIKKMIWINSSNVNIREKINIYNPVLWNEIKNYVIKTQKYILNSSY